MSKVHQHKVNGTIIVHEEDGEAIGMTLRNGPLYLCNTNAVAHLRSLCEKFGLVVVDESHPDHFDRVMIWIELPNQ